MTQAIDGVLQKFKQQASVKWWEMEPTTAMWTGGSLCLWGAGEKFEQPQLNWLPIKRGLNLLEACHLVRQNQAQIKIKVLLGMTVMCWFLLALPFLTILRPIADRIHTASCTYIHVLSLCHLYPLPFTWRIANENFQKIIAFLMQFSSQLYT